MRNRRSVYVAVVVILLCSLSSFGRHDVEDLDANWIVSGHFDDFEEGMTSLGETLLEIKAPLSQAVGFASMGTHSITPEDLRLNAQAIINLVEGSRSELYDPAVEATAEFGIGLWDLFWDLFRMGTEWSQLDDETLRDNRLVDESTRYIKLLHLVSESVQASMQAGADARDVENAFLIAHILLLAVQEGIQDMLRTWCFEFWVSPGESIQAAIDAAREGAVIYIEMGVYRESLEITKSLTLDGWAGADLSRLLGDVRIGYGVTIQPVSSQTGITVTSNERIIVTLRQIEVKGASQAIFVEGSAGVTVEKVDIVESEVGVTTADSAILVMSDCYVELNEVAVQATDGSVVRIDDCSIQHNESAMAAIHLLDDVHMLMTNTEVALNNGHGILVQDQAVLVVNESSIRDNVGDGVHLAGSSTLEMNGTRCSANRGFGVRAVTDECPSDGDIQEEIFLGTVTGTGNSMPARGDIGPNHQGGICPESLQFLTDDLE